MAETEAEISYTTHLSCSYCGKDIAGGFCQLASDAVNCPYKASADTLAERKRCAAVARQMFDDCGVYACTRIAEEIERGE